MLKLSVYILVCLPMLLIMQFGVLPYLGLGDIGPDLFALWIFFSLVRFSVVETCASAFFVGLAVDILASPRLGVMAIGFLAGVKLLTLLKRRLPFDRMRWQMAWVFLLAFFLHVWAWGIGKLPISAGGVSVRLWWALPIAINSALAWPLVSLWLVRAARVSGLISENARAFPRFSARMSPE